MILKVIYVNDGYNGKTKYYYWDEFDTWEDAIKVAKNIKKERKNEMKIKYYVLETEEGRFLPVPKYILYLNRRLKIW